MLVMCSQGAEFALGNPVEFENDGIITDGRVVLLDQQQASSVSKYNSGNSATGT